MEFRLNNAPELTMLEITKKMFNTNFLSNIEFNVEGKVILAHSLELMKRSTVFQKQLESVKNQPQVIPIDNYTYKSFFEFIRFIYTEDCDITVNNGVELFKLAMEYKVVKLENQVLDFLLQRGVPLRIRLEFYAFCVTENYELPYNVIKNDIARNLNAVMELDNFTLMEPNVIEDILKLDCVDENIKEVQIFNGLIRWMNKYCENNQIDLTQRRQNFQKLLQLIRYPNMTMDEFRGCVLNNCDLFADSDLCGMFKDPTPAPKARKSCDKKYDRRNILNTNTKSETKFTVSKDLLLTGFRYGSGGNHEVRITGRDLTTNNTDVIKLNRKFKDDSIYKTISLGESLILQSNREYSIQIAYDNGGYTCWCATYRMSTIIIHDPLSAVEILQPGVTMFEIFFKPINIETKEDPGSPTNGNECLSTKSSIEQETAETTSELPKTEISREQVANGSCPESQICEDKSSKDLDSDPLRFINHAGNEAGLQRASNSVSPQDKIYSKLSLAETNPELLQAKRISEMQQAGIPSETLSQNKTSRELSQDKISSTKTGSNVLQADNMIPESVQPEKTQPTGESSELPPNNICSDLDTELRCTDPPSDIVIALVEPVQRPSIPSKDPPSQEVKQTPE